MPWNPLRPERPSEKSLRRRSILDPVHDLLPTATNEHAPSPITEQSMGRSRIRDSVVSLSAVSDTANLERAGRPTESEKPIRPRRFSMLRFRHASDSQLAKTAKEHAIAHAVPPMPILTPSIITTAPTQDNMEGPKKKSPSFTLSRRQKSPSPAMPLSSKSSRQALSNRAVSNGSRAPSPNPNPNSSRVTFDHASRPPAYGDESSSALALPVARLSESSRSDESSGDHGLFATTTTTHTVSTTTTFFRLPRRKKDKGPLFPLPARGPSTDTSAVNTPRLSTTHGPSDSPLRQSFSFAPSGVLDGHAANLRRSGQSSPTHSIVGGRSKSFAGKSSGVVRSNSSASIHSGRPSSVAGRPSRLGSRGRSSTMSSLRRDFDEDSPPMPPQPPSMRTSTSSRPSLGGLFSLSRLRQSTEPLRSGMQIATPGTPGSLGSLANSLTLPKEPAFVIPERQEGDNPAKYLARLEEVVNRGAVVALLSKSSDEFSKNVMRSYMRRFKFFEDPLDMAVRKLLMHIELPKETQQIDRTLQAFADRYHECNPGIFPSPDEAYFVAFSILILHTDVFNKNNKYKMQKAAYVKNARGQGCAPEILECFYDNIAYTPFIHVEDEVDITGDRLIIPKARKSAFKAPGSSSLRKSGSEPVDPYTLILDGKLDTLRPEIDLDEAEMLQDPFNYIGTGASINLSELHRTFFRSGVIQILSTRSRPEAFMNQATISNPAEAQVGVVDIKVTKVGILWRKDTKRKKARSPWQEWGAILTGSQLYFFRNTSWIKSLMHQYDSHQKIGRSGTPVVFRPPLEQFKPDFLLSTEDVVALVDSQYKKHKNAFVFARQRNYQEIFLADSEYDMNDWLAKLNYAAAFRTAGVRMRGVIGGSYEGQKSRDSHQEEADASKDNASGATRGPASRLGRLDDDLTRQVMIARRQILAQKISEANERLAEAEKSKEIHLRTARHLHVLAPIQQKTRIEVEESAIRLSAHFRWERMEFWRLRCHRDILEMDLAEDIKLASGAESQAVEKQDAHVTPQVSNHSTLKSGFARLNSKNHGLNGSSASTRPPIQPAGVKLFSMDDIFKSPTRLLSKHRPKSSWELPVLAFDRERSDSMPVRPPASADQSLEMSEPEVPSVRTERPDGSIVAAEIKYPAAVQAHDEHELLVEAGLVSPESQISEVSKNPDVGSEDDKFKVSESDGTDNVSKARHSLHRKLQNASSPAHHRSKRGKESTSSAGLSEDNSSTHEPEGLSRATGSFTVHGKKASIVTFGSEWQNMSPEERLNTRKVQAEEMRAGALSPLEDEAASDQPNLSPNMEPKSATGESFVTIKSIRRLASTDSSLPPPSPSLHSASSNRHLNGQEVIESKA